MNETTEQDKHPRAAARMAAAAAAIEWYEYFTFGNASALIFASVFFGPLGGMGGVLASFAVFAVGFGARPIGGIVAGHLGDRKGRKPMLVWSLVTIGVGTAAIGLLPTYHTAGIIAPALLVLLRIVQGLAVGAMYGASALLATEHAPKGRIGIFGSAVTLGVPIGLITANLVFMGVSSLVGADGFAAWAWRIPFLLGAVAVLLAWRVHVTVEETPEFQRAAAARASGGTGSPVATLIKTDLGTVLLAGLSYVVVTAVYYIAVAGILTYAVKQLDLRMNTILLLVTGASSVALLTLPFFAWLSDRFGRMRIYTIGAVATLMWAIPMFLLIDTGTPLGVFLGIGGAIIVINIMSGPQVPLFKELFAADVRYSGVSLAYQIASIAGGAVAPFIMVLMYDTFETSMAISAYIMMLAVISLACIAGLRGRYARRIAAAETTSVEMVI
ncbi:MFS transporter [Streptomyces sp. NPDC032161]|uniref:MFS transporter n=1 Tax=unclassified Streptomyces TaxID=2593676 RepID=UPI0034076796